MKVVGGNSSAKVQTPGREPAKVHSFSGPDPSQWRTNVPAYDRITYRSVLPGIDLAYYSKQQKLEYDFIIRPGSRPGSIALSFEGADGIKIDRRGNLRLHTPAGIVTHARPFAYQVTKQGEKRRVPAEYRVSATNRVIFQVGAYDRKRPLIIDPEVIYSSYIGGASNDRGYGLSVKNEPTGRQGPPHGQVLPGRQGGNPARQTTNVYVAGEFQHFAQDGSSDTRAFVAKFDDNSRTLVWRAEFGPSAVATGVDVDHSGNVFVSGYTQSPNFPRTSGTCSENGDLDGFLLKLDQSGSAIRSKCLGGPGEDLATGVAVDPAGNAYLTGLTCPYFFENRTIQERISAFSFTLTTCHARDAGFSYNPPGQFPVTPNHLTFTENVVNPETNQLEQKKRDCDPAAADAFAARFAPNLRALYSTCLGGLDFDAGAAITVDDAGNAYLTGMTHQFECCNFPVTETRAQEHYGGGLSDGFVAKISAEPALVYSTTLGGVAADGGAAIDVDGLGRAVVVGFTYSGDFPTHQAFQPLSGSNTNDLPLISDAFVSKLAGDGSGFVYSSYLGGVGRDWGMGVAVDPEGNSYVSGHTSSADFPTLFPAQPCLSYGTIFHGRGREVAYSGDAFASKVGPEGARLWTTCYGGTGDEYTGSGRIHLSQPANALMFGNGAAVDSSGNVFLTGTTVSSDLPRSTNGGQGAEDSFVAKLDGSTIPIADSFLHSTRHGPDQKPKVHLP